MLAKTITIIKQTQQEVEADTCTIFNVPSTPYIWNIYVSKYPLISEKYSRTSMAGTLMACLLRLYRTRS